MPQRTRALALPVAFVLLLATAAAFAPRAQERELDGEEIADGLTMVTGGGGNVVVLDSGDGVLVVDSMLASVEEAYVAAVAAAGEGRKRFLVNTHWHGDHAGNNAAVAALGAEVVAHANVRRRLAGDGTIEGRTADDTPPAALPSVTFEDGLALHVGPHEVVLRHVGPAHTDGDAFVWFPGPRVVHMGDCFFNGTFPFVDRASGGSVVGLLELLDATLAELDESWTIVPGHGPLASRADLVRYRDMIDECVTRVRAGVAAGKGFEELLAEGGLSDLSEWNGFVDHRAFLSVIVQELTAPGEGR